MFMCNDLFCNITKRKEKESLGMVCISSIEGR